MKSKRHFLSWLIPSLLSFILLGTAVFITDPFFHYRAPDADRYYYVMDNERSQNDGILKHFDYNAVIIGSSMTKNFETSAADRIFGVHSVKTPYSGASFREIRDNLETAFRFNPGIVEVIRGLDYVSITSGPAGRKAKLPEYLYDRNPFNDVEYLLNRDILFNRAFPMISDSRKEGFLPGITSFDDYDRFYHPSGMHYATYDGIPDEAPGKASHLTDEETAAIRENISLNVLSIAQEHPETEFHCFFTPYSAAWWQSKVADGTIYRHIEAEKQVIELALTCDNLHLYSFNLRTDITTDMNNYSDPIHYSEWVNSLILNWIRSGEGLLTTENYLDYLERELDFYSGFDYLSMNSMPDYENDLYAAALVNEELTGVKPAVLAEAAFGNETLTLPETEGHRYLVFEVNLERAAEARVSVYNSEGAPVSFRSADQIYRSDGIDSPTSFIAVPDPSEGASVISLSGLAGQEKSWQQIVLDFRSVSGDLSVLFDADHPACFRQAVLY